jgi:FkbH-like protein
VKLAEALSIVRKAPAHAAPLKVVLACGFTPLHLQNFFAAHLQQAHPDRKVEVSVGLFEDIPGTLKMLGTEGVPAGALAIEWSDLDSRLGYRHLGGWGQRVVPSLLENVEARLKHFDGLISQIPSSTSLAVSLPTLPLPPGFHTAGWHVSEAELALHELVLNFARHLAAHPSVSIVSEQRLDADSPAPGRYDFRSDLNTGFPYSLPHAEVLARALAGLLAPRKPKKGLITDLDDTLWAGLIGEVGHDQVSWDLASHTQFHGLYQQMLGALADQGVLIAIASKNTSEIAQKGLARTDLMISGDKIFPIEIHWEPKSGSVGRILKAWNIGADSVVFVDDSPMELAEVQAAHPDVECLLFPKSDYQAGFAFLQKLRDLFGKPRLSEEDSYRLQSIRQGQQFQDAATSGDSTEDLLAAAEAQITLEFDPPPGDKRVVELVNKTNQFNLNGVRFTDGEWHEKASDPNTFTLAISYQDKFGPLGKIAAVQGTREEKGLRIHAWVMSCRAFSRRIEHQTLAQLFERYRAESIAFDFTPTPKNKPIADFLRDLLNEEPGNGVVLTREGFNEKLPKLYHQLVEKNG